MAYGSRHTRSLSFSSDGTVELVALELDEDIQLSCQCGQCEKERKIWLDLPTDFQYASEFMSRIKDRYHLTSDIRLFFLSFYMAPTTPIFVMRMARGILKVMPGIGVMGGDRTMRRQPIDLQEDQQMNVADIEEAGILHQRNMDENIQETMGVEELSPVIERVRRKRRAPTPYPINPDSLHDIKVSKKKRRRSVDTSTEAKIRKRAQQDGGKKGPKRSSQSSVRPRDKKPVSYFRSPSKTPDENEDPYWSADRDGSIS